MLLLIQYTLIFSSVLILVALGGCFSEHSGVINLGPVSYTHLSWNMQVYVCLGDIPAPVSLGQDCGGAGRQSGVVEHQLDVALQAVAAGELHHLCQQERRGLLAVDALGLALGQSLLYGRCLLYTSRCV